MSLLRIHTPQVAINGGWNEVAKEKSASELALYRIDMS